MGVQKVHMASTPIGALRLVEETSLSVAVLDFGSRGDDDAPLCRTLRAHRVPFMYYSGLDDLDYKSLGAPIVTKPASAETLITTMTRLLRLSPGIKDTDHSPDEVAF
jgi:DNA-binding response OmpR family regulator